MDPIRIFISYAHANAIWLRKTVRDRAGVEEANPRDLLSYWHNGLRRHDAVDFWYDSEENKGLRGGDPWKKRIFEEIDRADVGVLLITQEFVQSAFIRDEELPRMVARADQGQMDLVPVLVEPAEWEELELASFQLTPGRPTPLLQFLSEHEQHFKTAMLEILKALKAKVRRARQRRGGAGTPAKLESPVGPEAAEPPAPVTKPAEPVESGPPAPSRVSRTDVGRAIAKVEIPASRAAPAPAMPQTAQISSFRLPVGSGTMSAPFPRPSLTSAQLAILKALPPDHERTPADEGPHAAACSPQPRLRDARLLVLHAFSAGDARQSAGKTATRAMPAILAATLTTKASPTHV